MHCPWIEINEKDPPTDSGERRGEIDAGGSFADAALLVGYHNADHFLALTPAATMMKLSPSLALPTHRKSPCHVWRTSASSRCAPRPLGSAQRCFLWTNVRISSGARSSDATARAVITSNEPPTRSTFAQWIFITFSNSDSHTLWRNSARKRSRLDQCHRAFDEAGDHDPRQARARADVHPGCAGARFEAHELRRIEDVPLPDVAPQARSRDPRFSAAEPRPRGAARRRAP